MDNQLFTDGVWRVSGWAAHKTELDSVPIVDFILTYAPNNPTIDISSQSLQQNIRMLEATPKLYKLVLKQCTLCKVKARETECDTCEIGQILREIRGEC